MRTRFEPDPRASSRDAYWDAWRGIAILLVVLIHTRTGVDYLGTDAAWNFDFWVVERQMINFPVALFLFLAGFFVNPDRIRPVAAWLRTRAKKLLIPFLIWSAVFALIGVAVADSLGNPIALGVRIIFGLTAAHLYFIVVLIQLTVLTPLLLRSIWSRWAWALFAITPAYVLGLYGYAAATGTLPFGYNYPFFGWFAFYYAGLWIRLRGVPRVNVPVALTLSVTALLVSVAEAYGMIAIGLPTGLATSQLKLSSVVYSFAVFALVLALKGRWQTPFGLRKLGTESYGIYYVHMVWIILLDLVLYSIPALEEFGVLAVIQLAQVIITLALSLATMWFARRVLGARRAASTLGF